MFILFLMTSLEDPQMLVNTVEIGSRKRFPVLQILVNALDQFMDEM